MIGKTILHYKIIEKLGEGGMGVVYKALDTKLDREVALKFLPRQIAANDEERERFKIEAQAAAALNHNHIATIYAIEETDEETFIVMEHIKGDELKSLIKLHPKGLPVADAAMYVRQIADGLTAAHEAGIIHRDIKSANIMISEKNQVKVMDFGLAKVSGGAQLTKAGTTLGTAAYMSPEQARGEEADQRSDIWAVGVVLYEMLTGRLPFGGDYEQAVIYAILHEDPEPISKMRDAVPKNLQDIVRKALNKDPDQRFQTTEDLLAALNHSDVTDDEQKGQAGDKDGPMNPNASGRKSRPGRRILMAAGLLLLIVVVTFVVIRGFEFSHRQDKTAITAAAKWSNSVAVLPFADLSPEKDQEYFCDGMTEQIITNISHIRDLRVIARTSVMTFKGSNKTIPQIAAELHVRYVLEGSIRKAGDRIRVTAQLINVEDSTPLWAKEYDRKLQDIFGVQDDVSQAIATALFEQLSPVDAQAVRTQQTDNVTAYESHLKGQYFHHEKFLSNFRQEDFKKSEQLFLNAIELDPNYGLAYAGLADLYDTYLRHYGQDEEHARMRLEYAEKAAQLYPNSVYVNTVKGWTHWGGNHYDEAYESMKRALKLNPNDGYSLISTALLLSHFGLHYRAIAYLTRAVQLDPLFSNSYASMGRSYDHLGEFGEARSSYERALELDPENLLSLNALAEQAVLEKQFDQAEEFLNRCIAINPDYPRNKITAAWLLAVKGKEKEAVALHEDDIVYILLGKKDEAIRMLNRQHNNGWPLGITGPLLGNYLSMQNFSIYASLRDDPRFIDVLEKEKARYEELLRKYGE